MKKRCLLITMLMLFAVSVQAVAAGQYAYWDFTKAAYPGLTVESNNGSASCRDGVLQMGRTAAGGTNPRFKFSFDKACGQMEGVSVLEMDMKTTADSFLMYFQNSPLAGSIFRVNLMNGTRLRVSAGNAAGKGNDNIFIKEDLVQDEWFHLKFVVDYPNKTMSIYLDGALICDSRTFFYNANVDYAGSFYYILMEHNGSTGAVSMANFALYSRDDASIVGASAEALSLDAVAEDDLTLPVEGYDGAEISWSSSDETVVGPDGTVHFPAMAEGDKTVTLTANVTKGTESVEKPFVLTVPARMTDEEAVEADISALQIATALYDSASLPAVGTNGSVITWAADNKEAVVISDEADGGQYAVTTNRKEENIPVVLTATVTKGNVTKMKPFSVVVQRIVTDEMSVKEDLEQIVLPETVTENFTLPAAGNNASSFSWTSANPDYIAVDGYLAQVVYRGTEDVPVVLTARAVKGAAEAEQTFTVTVAKDVETNLKLLKEAVSALNLERTTNLTTDIELPAEGINGTAITWSTSDAAVITAKGEITRASYAQSASLTAELQKGTLTETKVFRITVKGTSSSSGGGGGGGGGGSISSGRVTSTVVLDPPEVTHEPEIEQNSTFTDVGTEHWAFQEIETLVQKDIINGDGTGRFEPERPVSREEFVKMLVCAQKLDLEQTDTTFSDVEAQAWYGSYIAAAAANGLVAGEPDGSFGIGKNITREQMAVMVYRAVGGKPQSTEGYADADAISPFAVEAVYGMRELGLMSGGLDNCFRPSEFATRAEAAALIGRMLALQN